MGGSRSVLVAVAAAAMLGTVAGSPIAAAKGSASKVATPTVTGPVTGGNGDIALIGTTFDDASVGYTYEEHFLEGKATSYSPAKPFGPNGKWKVKTAETAPYKTRIVVHRPAQQAAFNGTVYVEWLNVTAGFDSPPDWLAAHTEIIRQGAVWIGVSAQSVGIRGGGEAVGGQPAGGITKTDPERYGSLQHPGDEFSYDMFSQTGVVARGKGDSNPLTGLKVERVIGMGESQSAFRMVTYVNAIHPTAHVYDGFLIHSRGASGASIGKSDRFGNDDAGMPKTAAIRSDLDVPVLTFQTETDLTRLGYLPARQKDTKRFRLWEVAGTSHADAYTTGKGFSDNGSGAAEQALLDPAQIGGGPLNCTSPINSGPAFAVLDAAVFQLDRWVREGTPPPKAPRLEATADPEPAITRDEHGNAKGGIRTPLLDVPTSTLDGEPNAGGSFCGLFGNTKPFGPSVIGSLYGTQTDYAAAFAKAADKAVKAGFLVQTQADNFKKAAATVELGIPD